MKLETRQVGEFSPWYFLVCWNNIRVHTPAQLTHGTCTWWFPRSENLLSGLIFKGGPMFYRSDFCWCFRNPATKTTIWMYDMGWPPSINGRKNLPKTSIFVVDIQISEASTCFSGIQMSEKQNKPPSPSSPSPRAVMMSHDHKPGQLRWLKGGFPIAGWGFPKLWEPKYCL